MFKTNFEVDFQTFTNNGYSIYCEGLIADHTRVIATKYEDGVVVREYVNLYDENGERYSSTLFNPLRKKSINIIAH